MSWWVSLDDPVTGAYLPVENFSEGGTYVLGGSTEADINITYNYGKHYGVLGEKGLDGLNGMTAKDALPILERGVASLGDEMNDDYWKATEGNAKRPLVILASWCRQAIVGDLGNAKISVR